MTTTFVLKNLRRLFDKYTAARTEHDALVKSKTKIFSNFVAFSENPNFNLVKIWLFRLWILYNFLFYRNFCSPTTVKSSKNLSATAREEEAWLRDFFSCYILQNLFKWFLKENSKNVSIHLHFHPIFLESSYKRWLFFRKCDVFFTLLK